jgi:hypothetical protein
MEELGEQGAIETALVSPEQLLPEIPAERVDALTAGQISHGRDFRVSPFGQSERARRIKAIDPSGRLVAIAEARLPLVYHPIVVL